MYAKESFYSVQKTNIEFYERVALIIKEISTKEKYLIIDEERYNNILLCAKDENVSIESAVIKKET